MKKNKKQVRAYSLGGIVLVVLLLVFIVLLVVGGISINLDGCEGVSLASVRAAPAEITYTDVMSDLKKDESFDPEAYPADETDYSLELVQLAESVNSELFVYVYAPAGMKATATEIRFSTAINDSFKPEDYALELLDYSGTLAKYKVKDFEVKPEALRYYDVVCVFRKWLEGVDKAPVGGQAVGSVSYPVGELWTACTLDGKVTYTVSETEVVLVSDKVCGFLRLDDGVTLEKTDNHYVAFSTDKPIDKLMEADVSYIYAPYEFVGKHLPTLDEVLSLVEGKGAQADVSLTADEEVVHTGNGWFARTYVWNTIQSVADFKASSDLSDSAKKDLEGKQWVLRFALTSYSEFKRNNPISVGGMGTTSTYTVKGTYVSDVTILRLKFETDGVTYNLGVVDNKQSSDIIPDNKPDVSDVPWWEKLFAAFKAIGLWLSKAFSWFGEHWKVLLVVLGCVVGGLFVVWVIVTILRKIAGK